MPIDSDKVKRSVNRMAHEAGERWVSDEEFDWAVERLDFGLDSGMDSYEAEQVADDLHSGHQRPFDDR